MPCPACKIILNENVKSAVNTFHRFADMDLLIPEDIERAMRADEKTLKVYRAINDGAAKRQEDTL